MMRCKDGVLFLNYVSCLGYHFIKFEGGKEPSFSNLTYHEQKNIFQSFQLD